MVRRISLTWALMYVEHALSSIGMSKNPVYSWIDTNALFQHSGLEMCKECASQIMLNECECSFLSWCLPIIVFLLIASKLPPTCWNGRRSSEKNETFVCRSGTNECASGNGDDWQNEVMKIIDTAELNCRKCRLFHLQRILRQSGAKDPVK